MAQVIIRNLPDRVVATLRARAKSNGRSLEAELRFILAQQALGGSSAGEAPVPYGVSSEGRKKTRRPRSSSIVFPKGRPAFDDVKPIKIRGKLLSETIIEDRR